MTGPFEGKKNVYLCPDCGHGFVTMDSVEGVTPFMTGCLNCQSMAQSLMYKIPQQVLGNPAVYWIRPPMDEWDKYSVHVRDHLSRGGLIRDDHGAKDIKKRKRSVRH
ncbi:hypothetical protein GCM10011360_17900 [Primorskyibacter flagellatus]|uniref:Uncharacterized protein n=1 Tax=Primorskyibacter flagellatus TaxID=1387277 RepID=A0A917EFW1_9RHOB|nr:hypothetical protein [Primorskyibacter flagellatus]GGE30296.1 hypothetical protein GCM10011360_17900 [Primorskyibacter flagellatus]